MGWIKISKKYRRMAADERLRDKALDNDWSGDAAGLLAHYEAEARALGVRLVTKSSVWGRLSRMSTTYYKEIRLGTGYAGLSTSAKAMLLAHELYHARQWRKYGRGTFRTRYLFWTRWRWAIEVQAYAESVRAMMALGAPADEVIKYMGRRPQTLWNAYSIKVLRKNNMWGATLAVLKAAHDEHEKRLAA